ncbi:ankyrin repeat-containing domain protein, partial [Colletotrichum lupini]
MWILDTIQERQDKQALIDELVGDRYCLLHYVVDRDWDDALRQLLSFNCDPDVRDSFGETPLHWAIQSGCHRSFEMLLAAGADVTIESNDGTTPLIEAVDCGELKFVREILAKITDVPRDPGRAPPLNWKTPSKNVHRLELIDHSRHNGENAFLLSCVLGPGSIVELLLQHGANIKALNADREGKTGLHMACIQGHCDVVDVLLSRHEAPELRDRFGCTPLWHACRGGHEEIVEYLADQNADIDLCDFEGDSPVAIATINGQERIATALLALGAKCQTTGFQGDTLLHCAAAMGSQAIIKHL